MTDLENTAMTSPTAKAVHARNTMPWWWQFGTSAFSADPANQAWRGSPSAASADYVHQHRSIHTLGRKNDAIAGRQLTT